MSADTSPCARRPDHRGPPGPVAHLPAGWTYTRGEWDHSRVHLGALRLDSARFRWRKCGFHRSFPQSFHSVAQSVDNFGAWGWCRPGNGRDTVAGDAQALGRPSECTIGYCNHRGCCPAARQVVAIYLALLAEMWYDRCVMVARVLWQGRRWCNCSDSRGAHRYRRSSQVLKRRQR